MKNPIRIPPKIRDSLPFSFTLSLALHLTILYFIGSWVIDLGREPFIQRFLITEFIFEKQQKPQKTDSQENSFILQTNRPK